jgi:hypothetical protein
MDCMVQSIGTFVVGSSQRLLIPLGVSAALQLLPLKAEQLSLYVLKLVIGIFCWIAGVSLPEFVERRRKGTVGSQLKS